MDLLTCSNCGNQDGWYGAVQTSDGTQTATCADCGHTETRTGGVVMGTVTGSMTQSVTRRKD